MSSRRYWSHLAGAGASVLAGLSLWLPWYGFSLPGVSGSPAQAKSLGLFGLLTVDLARKLASVHMDAWQALHGKPAILAVAAVIVALLSGLLASGRARDRRLGWAAAAAALAAVLFDSYEIFHPSTDPTAALVHAHWGAFVSLGCAVIALVATLLASLDGLRPPVVLAGAAPSEPAASVPALTSATPAASVPASTSIAPPGW
jgi:hypothetical protein